MAWPTMKINGRIVERNEDKVTDLEALCGERYKVEDDGTHDPDRTQHKWTRQIFGIHGIIYPQGYDGSLAVCAYHSVTANKLGKMGFECLSGGKGSGATVEIVYKFYPKDIDTVAELIIARKKRHLSPEQKAKCVARLAKWRLGKSDSKPS